MSVRLMARVWELDLDHAEQAVLLSLADYADDDGGHLFPSQALVAWRTGYSERQVRRVMAGLKDRGALEVIRKGNQFKRPQYRLKLDGIALKPPRPSGHHGLPEAGEAEQALESTGQDGRSSPESGRAPATGDRKHRPSTTEPRPQLRPVEPPVEPPVDPPVDLAAARRRDLPFEALCRTTGIDWKELTGKTRGPVNSALKEIRAAAGDVDPVALANAILERGRNYRTHFDAAMTPQALGKHWAMCAEPREHRKGVTAREMAQRAARDVGDESGPVGVTGFIDAAVGAAGGGQHEDEEERGGRAGRDDPRSLPEPGDARGHG